MKPPHRKFLLWTLVILWMSGIFAFSAQDAHESSAISGHVVYAVVDTVNPRFSELPKEHQDSIVSDLQHITRKTAHVLVYMVLGVLCMAAFMQHTSKRPYIPAALLSAFYAASDELHQVFVAGRGPQITDVMIDTAGACAGITIVLLILHVRKKSRVPKNAALI